MAELVNLRRVRKNIERARRQVAASEARVRHGRPLAERAAMEAEKTRGAAALEAHRLTLTRKADA